MAEYLKNKPIALRHCLLYVFLQERSVKKAFTEFCKVIGKDAITEEELNFWFDKFKNGIFDIEKDKKPISDMRDVFRSDKYALRACILYETIKYKLAERGFPTHRLWPNSNILVYKIERNPSFFLYNHFCKVIGDDVMEYREFDFWFYRFLNGNYELNYERDKDKKIYKLMEMPNDVMKNIVEYLDITDRLKLERTSQSLHLFSKDQKVFHGELTFEADRDIIYIRFGVREVIKYKKEEDDCEVEFRNSKKVLRGVSYLKQSFQDFKKILENPMLYLQTLTISSRPEDSDSFQEHIEDALKFTHLLHVKHITFRTRSMKTLLKIFRSLTPGYLTTINIDIDIDESTIEELVETEQWKQAKYLYMSDYRFVGPLRHLYHFHKFFTFPRKLQEDDVREMKEVLLKSLDFEKCILYFLYIDDPFPIIQEFGGAIEGSIDTCHYPIPNSTEYFEIFVFYHVIKIERKKK